ncbi:hypothetical protein NIA69_21155 [Gemmiger formicilis]|nr:hypothetical protein [Gemmiger formicilis]
MRDDLDLRAYAVYTVLLTVATSFKASLIFAFAPALLVLLIADFVRTRAKNLKNEIIMGCSVFPGVALCFIQANVLFAEEGSGIRLIFTVPFDHHRMLWGRSMRPACWGWRGPSSLWRQWGCCWAARRGRASATGSVFSPSPSRWPRRCCWSKAVSGSITPTSGGGRSSASGCSGSSPSASFAADAHRGRAPLAAGRLRRRTGVAHRQRRLLLSHAFAGCKL